MDSISLDSSESSDSVDLDAIIGKFFLRKKTYQGFFMLIFG
jgi:hypothetical protein